MAITPAAGYQIDPNNPNGVIPIGSQAQVNNPNALMPAANAPVTPSPQPATPPAPVIPQPASQPVNPQQTGAVANQVATTGALTMPANGSVVDLLNAAGQSSDFASRQALAQQYGIQNYTGTGAQNQQLAQKYLAAYNAKKGTTVPQNGADARSAISSYLDQNSQQVNPQQQFMDVFSGMNPIEANIYQQLSGLLSTTNDQQSLTDLYNQTAQQFDQQSGVKNPELQRADITRIMNGTEDDIRAEITNAGGFATESQVQALTGARNKVLINKASYLQNVINAKNDYVDRIVSLTQADRKQVSDDLDRKLGITKTLFDMTETMQNNARDNMNNIVSAIGYNGLAESLQNDPAQQAQAENLLGLPKGALSNPAFLAAASPTPKLTTQVVEVDGRKALLTYDGMGNPVNAVDLGSAATAGSGGLTPGQVNAFNSIVSKYNSSPLIQASDRTSVLQGIISNVKKDPANAAQQLNLAYSYIQALDTYQSSVREGELGLVNSIDSKIGQLSNSVQQIQNGEIVRPEVALQIANTAQTLVDTINGAAKQKAASFESQANVVGLGSYWNQYVNGFNQNYNKSVPGPKGKLTSSQYVEQSLNQQGVSYQKVLEDAPLGQIGVIDNETGEVGYVPAEEYDQSLYTRI